MPITARNHLPVTDQVAEDLVKIIDQAPTSFELLVFKANIDDVESVTDMPDLVGNLEAREKTISFADPVISKALMLPNEQPGMLLAHGLGEMDFSDEPVSMLVKEPGIPEQSVFWFEEQVSETELKVTLLYVLRSEPIGINGQAGSIHVVMPFAQGADTLPDIIQPSATDSDEQAVEEPDECMPQWVPKPIGQGLKDQLARLVDAIPGDDDVAIMRELPPFISMDDDLDEETLNKQAVASGAKYAVMADFIDNLKHCDATMPENIDLYESENVAVIRDLRTAFEKSDVDQPEPVPAVDLDDLLNEDTANKQAAAAEENFGKVAALFESLGAVKNGND